MSFLLAFVIYGAFGFLDPWCLPKTYPLALAIRGFVICPLLALVAASTFFQRTIYRWIQPLMALVAAASGMGIVLMIRHSSPEELGASHYYVGLILVMMFAYAFICLRFWHALVANGLTLVCFEVLTVAHLSPLATHERLVTFTMNNFFLVGANLIGASTCYWLELAARRDFVQRLALAEEKAKSDRLLLNILPEVIVERMKRTPGTIADELAGVSILFADLVNFTELSTRMGARQLVGTLNDLFTTFDELVVKHGLEKIKTIGDCYMVASGVPKPRADHARAVVELALDMREHLNAEANNHGILKIRIGINSGPVIAGVLGTRKFVYDLWGDTVNTASRMESHGVAGQIQISKATHDLIRDQFKLESGGVKAVKGKGNMEVWYVIDRAETSSLGPTSGIVPSRSSARSKQVS